MGSLESPKFAEVMKNTQDLGKIIGIYYPPFIVLFLLIASFFNSTFLKGIIYLVGLLPVFAIWALNNKDKTPEHINSSAYISWYTFFYLFLPMIESSQVNPYIIGVLLFGSIFNMFVESKNKDGSTTLFSVIFGMIIGTIAGVCWFIFLLTSDNGNNRKFLFYNEMVSNNVVCTAPKKQTFKCSVYKNGELLSSNIV
jgi:hypothetical protein